MVHERELDYWRSFPANMTREQIAAQLLQDLGLDGTHDVHGGKDGSPLASCQSAVVLNLRGTFSMSSAIFKTAKSVTHLRADLALELIAQCARKLKIYHLSLQASNAPCNALLDCLATR